MPYNHGCVLPLGAEQFRISTQLAVEAIKAVFGEEMHALQAVDKYGVSDINSPLFRDAACKIGVIYDDMTRQAVHQIYDVDLTA